MRNILVAAFTLLASPALATGLLVQVEGDGANGLIHVDLFEDIAPRHVERMVTLAQDGQYDGVYFHRVIDGFMAQTGDVEFGKDLANQNRMGMGGSDLPDLKQEFSSKPFDRGVVGMARSQDPNSANSQFFIMFSEGHFLNNEYTVVGEVTSGLDILDAIKRGNPPSGAVTDGAPDRMVKVIAVQ